MGVHKENTRCVLIKFTPEGGLKKTTPFVRLSVARCPNKQISIRKAHFKAILLSSRRRYFIIKFSSSATEVVV